MIQSTRLLTMRVILSWLLVVLFTLSTAFGWIPSFRRRTQTMKSASNCSPRDQSAQNTGGSDGSRRNVLSIGLGVLTNTLLLYSAQAFPNKISNQYDDRPKRRGPQPQDLRVAKRTDALGEEYLGLKSCSFAPNCFSSSITDDPDHAIPPWYFPTTLSSAMDDLSTVLRQYLPGQNGIDGGGFEIKNYDPVNGYIYVQFESLKNGYIDDFEVAWVKNPENALQVRSSSRIGYLDYGVNAKRINYIAKELRNKGWKAEGVDYKTHRFYASENELKF